jgi:hypothetical protein
MSQDRDGKIIARGWHGMLKELKGAHVACIRFSSRLPLAYSWHLCWQSVENPCLDGTRCLPDHRLHRAGERGSGNDLHLNEEDRG